METSQPGGGWMVGWEWGEDEVVWEVILIDHRLSEGLPLAQIVNNLPTMQETQFRSLG